MSGLMVAVRIRCNGRRGGEATELWVNDQPSLRCMVLENARPIVAIVLWEQT